MLKEKKLGSILTDQDIYFAAIPFRAADLTARIFKGHVPGSKCS